MLTFPGLDIHSGIASAVKNLLSQHQPDCIGGSQNVYNDILISCESTRYDFDLGKRCGFRINRWTTLRDKYIDQTEALQFVERANRLTSSGRAGIVSMVFKIKREEKAARRGEWGNCLLSLSYRVNKSGRSPTLILVSRATYLGYTSMLDAAIVHDIARYIHGLDIQFDWYIQGARISWFKLMPYIWTDRRLSQRLHQDVSTRTPDDIENRSWRSIVRQEIRIRNLHNQQGADMADLHKDPPPPFARIKRRWLSLFTETTLFKLPPSLTPAELRCLDG